MKIIIGRPNKKQDNIGYSHKENNQNKTKNQHSQHKSNNNIKYGSKNEPSSQQREADRDLMELIHELSKTYDNTDEFLNS